jgi:hypothetical protein
MSSVREWGWHVSSVLGLLRREMRGESRPLSCVCVCMSVYDMCVCETMIGWSRWTRRASMPELISSSSFRLSPSLSFRETAGAARRQSHTCRVTFVFMETQQKKSMTTGKLGMYVIRVWLLVVGPRETRGERNRGQKRQGLPKKKMKRKKIY